MLMTMRAYTEGCRAMATVAAAAYDAAHAHPDAEARKQNQAFYEFMVPLVKGYSTEMSLEVTSLGVQVHGGMGFIEETGAAQYYRDARILPIYEGTTAIQANDLVGRKTARDGGAVARRHRRRRSRPPRANCSAAAATPRKAMLRSLKAARQAFLDVVDFVAGQTKAQPERGLRRQRALPDAGRQRGVAAGRWRVRCWPPRSTWPQAATRSSCAPRSPPRASTATTS